MPHYEYRVVAAPTRGVKAKGIKSNEARFAHALEQLMNGMAEDGWEYQRAETLPSVERSGLTSSTTTWRNVMVFRRVLDTESQEADDACDPPAAPLALSAPEDSEELPGQMASAEPIVPPISKPQTPDEDASQSEGASRMLRDNGVEELSEVSGVSSSLKQLAENRSTGKTDS